jgi:4'-phosphopantetheinyl transferase
MTRALVRTVLSRYAAVSPEDWVFSANAYGRPTIDNAAAREARLSFNVSHSDGLVVLGVTKDCALGVDVERVSSREIPMDIANHYFAPTEVAALAEVPPYRQQYRFFEYWTFKESYIKARGMGLSLPLDKFSFRFPNDDTVEIDIHPALNDASRWQFWQFEPAADYLLAVCAEQTGGPSRSVVLRQIVPMMRETELAPRLLRALR